MKRRPFRYIKDKVLASYRASACRKARQALPKHGCYPTALERSIGLHGKGFADSFATKNIAWTKTRSFLISMENYIPNRLLLEKKPLNTSGKHWRSNSSLAEIKIGFQKGTVIVEEFQQWWNAEKDLANFNEAVGESWASNLLGRLEEHARKKGFEKVKIRVPESIHNYEIIRSSAQKKKLDEMTKFYEGLARERGYKRTAIFFEKSIK